MPTQRLLVFSVYVALQSYKLASSRTVASFLLHSGLDTAFWYGLPLLSIPWLRFKWSVVLLFVLLSAAFNCTWFVYQVSGSALLALVFSPFSVLLRLLGFAAQEEDKGLIRGKYVVDMLPEAKASLDKIGKLCIVAESSQTAEEPIYLQLNVENAWPSSVILGRQSLLEPESYTQTAFDAQQLAQMPSDSSNIYLPVSEAGAYYLDRIVDGRSGLRVTIDRKRIVIPPCPSVQLRPLTTDVVCPGEEVYAQVGVFGVQPFKVHIDNAVLDIRDDTHAEMLDPSTNRPLESVLALNHTISKRVGADTSFRVTRVEDAMGHVVDVDLGVDVRVLTPASAVVHYGKLPMTGSSSQFTFKLDGTDAPFQAVFTGPDGEFVFEAPTAGTHTITVDKPGHYALTAVDGAKCKGRGQGSVDVFVPPDIQAKVKFEEVVDKCAGPIGVDAKISLVGSSPFRVFYEVLKNGAVSDSGVSVYKEGHALMRFRPREAGSYVYKVVKVEDMYRETRLAYETVQEISELPGAELLPLSGTKLCESGHLKVNARVRGSGPFILKYSVDNQQEFEVSTANNVSSVVTFENELTTGRHQVRLISLTDANGCVTELADSGLVRSPTITVQKELPTIAFATPGVLKATDPVEAALPVLGDFMNYPAKVYYEHSHDGSVSTGSVVLHSSADLLNIRNPGTYKLLKIEDGVCGGSAKPDEVVVNTYVRPSLLFATNNATNASTAPAVPVHVCRLDSKTFTQQSVEILARGEAPFVVIHEQVDPNGQSHVKKFQLSGPSFELTLANDQAGRYAHYLWVMDSWYPDFNEKEVNLQFVHNVHAPPDAFFGEQTANDFEVCEGENLTEAVIPELIGQAPFHVSYELGSSRLNRTVMADEILDFAHDIGAVQTDAKKLRLVSVSDATGCSSQLSAGRLKKQHSHEIRLRVLPKPALPELEETDYCVGDLISIPLGKHVQELGVSYRYLGQLHHEVAGPRLVRRATEPGALELVSLTGPNGCRRETSLEVNVHALPRSNITEQSHFSIYMGDQIELGFSFEGTPPFRFQYARLVDGVEKERTWVENVEGYNHSILVAEGGTYEIVELYDKYCRSFRTRL